MRGSQKTGKFARYSAHDRRAETAVRSWRARGRFIGYLESASCEAKTFYSAQVGDSTVAGVWDRVCARSNLKLAP